MVANNQQSPAATGLAKDMPSSVTYFLVEVAFLLRTQSIPIYADMIIKNAKALITGRTYEDLFALELNANYDG